MAPFMTPWSVRPRAGWPNSAARLASALMLAAPSSSEYSEWTWRWAQDWVTGRVEDRWRAGRRDGRAGRRRGGARAACRNLRESARSRDAAGAIEQLQKLQRGLRVAVDRRRRARSGAGQDGQQRTVRDAQDGGR